MNNSGHQDSGGDNLGIHNARIINMLRGGILYVKIRKGMDMEDGEEGLPSSARQVILWLLWIISGGLSPIFMTAQAVNDCITAC